LKKDIKMNSDKTALVTGGAGFIGSHLCEYLISQGYYVICLDNFFTGSKQNLYKLSEHSKFEIIRHDVTEPIYLEVNEIYNLASPASPIHYQYNPVKTIKTNVMGSINMLGLAKRVKARILQASTSEVYGDPEIHPQKEEYWGNVNPVGLRACYDEGKRCAEALFCDYHRQNNVDIRIARIFNTYGPRFNLEDGRVISNFIVNALKGTPLEVYGDGSQTRSFCYISDLVEGLYKLMQYPEFPGPVNLGNPNEMTILQVAEKIIRYTGSKSQIIFKELPKDDPCRRKPDISLAQNILNWSPTKSFEIGLSSTISYFEKQLILKGDL